FRSRATQVSHVPDVEQIEAAVGKRDRPPRDAVFRDGGHQLGLVQHSSHSLLSVLEIRLKPDPTGLNSYFSVRPSYFLLLTSFAPEPAPPGTTTPGRDRWPRRRPSPAPRSWPCPAS